MSKYIVSSLLVFSNFDNEIPMIDKVVSVNKKPTIVGALKALKDYNENEQWDQIDDGTWKLHNDWHEQGDPIYYQVKIQTPKQHKEMVDSWIEYIKLNTTPRGTIGATN